MYRFFSTGERGNIPQYEIFGAIQKVNIISADKLINKEFYLRCESTNYLIGTLTKRILCELGCMEDLSIPEDVKQVASVAFQEHEGNFRLEENLDLVIEKLSSSGDAAKIELSQDRSRVSIRLMALEHLLSLSSTMLKKEFAEKLRDPSYEIGTLTKEKLRSCDLMDGEVVDAAVKQVVLLMFKPGNESEHPLFSLLNSIILEAPNQGEASDARRPTPGA